MSIWAIVDPGEVFVRFDPAEGVHAKGRRALPVVDEHPEAVPDGSRLTGPEIIIEVDRCRRVWSVAPARWEVPKLLVIERIGPSGHDAFALAIASLPPYQQARWEAAVRIASDDADARALLLAIGQDPDVILAPDPEI